MPAELDEQLNDDVQSVVDSAAAQIVESIGANPSTVTGAQIASQIGATLASLVGPLQESTRAQIAALNDMMVAMAAEFAAPAPQLASAPAVSLLDLVDPHRPNPAALGAALDGKFADFGEFVRVAISSTLRGRRDERVHLINEGGEIKADLTGEEIELGGALVPEEFRSELMMLMLQPNSIRMLATVLPMGTSTLSLPTIRDETHAGGSVYGGVRVYWTEAGEAPDESEPEFAQVRLTAKGLLALTALNNTLIADSALTVTALLGRMFSMATMWAEEAAFIRGDGVGKPLGILNAPALVTAVRETGKNNVDAEDVASLEGRLLPECDPYAVYMIHPGIRSDLRKMSSGSIQYWQQDMSKRSPMTLQGRPVIVNEHCSAPGTSGDIILVDWRMYLIGDRQAMSLAASEHARFSRNQTLLRSVARLDGQPWISTPLTPAQGTDTLSPFVVLA